MNTLAPVREVASPLSPVPEDAPASPFRATVPAPITATPPPAPDSGAEFGGTDLGRSNLVITRAGTSIDLSSDDESDTTTPRATDLAPSLANGTPEAMAASGGRSAGKVTVVARTALNTAVAASSRDSAGDASTVASNHSGTSRTSRRGAPAPTPATSAGTQLDVLDAATVRSHSSRTTHHSHRDDHRRNQMVPPEFRSRAHGMEVATDDDVASSFSDNVVPRTERSRLESGRTARVPLEAASAPPTVGGRSVRDDQSRGAPPSTMGMDDVLEGIGGSVTDGASSASGSHRYARDAGEPSVAGTDATSYMGVDDVLAEAGSYTDGGASTVLDGRRDDNSTLASSVRGPGDSSALSRAEVESLHGHRTGFGISDGRQSRGSRNSYGLGSDSDEDARAEAAAGDMINVDDLLAGLPGDIGTGSRWDVDDDQSSAASSHRRHSLPQARRPPHLSQHEHHSSSERLR